MSYQALARKWRPQTFAEVVGQEHVVSALSNALSSGRVHHAFLFSGTRGVGKTTLARIFAKALNCETGITDTPCGQCAACVGISAGNYVDLLEVDAASRTKVEDTREMLENVQYAPTLGRSKIYLIDEVHMLSVHSFNALLKTLEEPPGHVKFLLATTDPQKLPPTILSRCIQFNLKAMDIQQLQDHMAQILESEKIPFDSEGLRILARSAQGSVRDALSLLDQAIAHGNGEVRTDRVRVMLGMIDEAFALDLLRAVVSRDAAAVLSTVADMAVRAVDFRAALEDILTFLHNAALYQVNPDVLQWKGVDMGAVAEVAGRADAELVQLLYQMALLGKRDFALATDPRAGFEMTLLRMAVFQPDGTAPQIPGTTHTAPTRRQTGRLRPQGPQGGDDSVGSGARSPNGREQDSAAMSPLRSHDLSESADIDSATGWATFAQHNRLTGIPREIVMNMVPVRMEGDTLEVTLDSSHKGLLNDDRTEKIRQQCSDYLGREIQFKVTIGDNPGLTEESPAMRRELEKQERQAQAEKTFRDDPHVQEMLDQLGAEIVPDSIRPPSQESSTE